MNGTKRANANIICFPGEGRGPEAKVGVIARSARSRPGRNWAPAFVGEAALDQEIGRGSVAEKALKQVQGDGVCISE
ncbi:MAG: hypothetical protein B7Y47_12950 [Sphingomonas sp. 28-63-12]|nr:MAG: hypothetical protein B7Y47_12950 [Sphingomonas sp. 28-63-12]